MSDPSVEYLAGFFDGEGCITDGINGAWPSMRCQITQVDPRPLRVFQARYGGSLKPTKASRYNPQARDGWVYTVLATRAAAMLRELLPFLVLKHDEAQAALAYQASLSAGTKGHTLNESEAAVRQKLLDKWYSIRYATRTASYPEERIAI